MVAVVQQMAGLLTEAHAKTEAMHAKVEVMECKMEAMHSMMVDMYRQQMANPQVAFTNQAPLQSSATVGPTTSTAATVGPTTTGTTAADPADIVRPPPASALRSLMDPHRCATVQVDLTGVFASSFFFDCMAKYSGNLPPLKDRKKVTPAKLSNEWFKAMASPEERTFLSAPGSDEGLRRRMVQRLDHLIQQKLCELFKGAGAVVPATWGALKAALCSYLEFARAPQL